MKTNSLKIDCRYRYVKDGGKQTIVYLGMDGEKYKFAPIMANGKQFGPANGLTENEVSKYVYQDSQTN